MSLKSLLTSDKSKQKNAAKLSPENQDKVLRQIAGGRTATQIVRWAEESLGISMHRQNIQSYYMKSPIHEAKIAEYRREHDAAIGAEKYAHKRARLQQLSEIYEEIRERGKEMSRAERNALMDAATVMDKIDGLVSGKKRGETNINVQFNKYSNMSTPDLLKQAGILSNRLSGERIIDNGN